MEQGQADGKAAATSPRQDAAVLAVLLRDLHEARGHLQESRANGHTGTERLAQADFVTALRAYVDALTSRRLPVPYALRDELRIHGDAMRRSQ